MFIRNPFIRIQARHRLHRPFKSFVKLMVAVSLIGNPLFFANSYAASAFTPARPLAGGSGGNLPPRDTRPYKNPGGGFDKDGSGKGSGNSLAKTKFKSVFYTDESGKTIYYEGLVDAKGRTRVFKYSG